MLIETDFDTIGLLSNDLATKNLCKYYDNC